MDSIEKAIQAVLPQLDEAKLETFVNELVKVGVEGPDDLQFIQEDDIKHLLTPIQCRKIIHSLKEYLNRGNSLSRLRKHKRTQRDDEDGDDDQPAVATCARIDSYGCVRWQPEDYPDGETSASLEEKKLEMMDIFSREGLKGAERGRVEDLMAITYAKQREYINAKPSPSILDVGKEWPFLFSQKFLLSHFTTLTNVELYTRLNEDMDKKGKRLLDFFSSQITKCRKEVRAVLKEAIKKDREGSDGLAVMLVMLAHFKEQEESLFLIADVKKTEASEMIVPADLRLYKSQIRVRSDSHVSSSVSLKSDRSKGEPLNFSERKPSSNKRLQYETLDSDVQTHRKHESFTDDLLWIFQDLERKIITFLKKELEKFKKILQNENKEYFVKDFIENRCSTKAAALDLTLHYLREMKQDEAADALEDELFFIHQLKCGLKKKYQCVFEGIAKQGDSTLLNNIYTDLYITQGGSEQVNTEHEVRQIEVASRRHESQEIQVECRNLFEAPEQDEEIRTVLTKGVAGIGKSVSVQKFVLDWAEGKENQDIRLIFPLPFREMNLKEKETLSLMDLITQFFPETKGLNLTRRNQFKVLFILDGLDECRLPLKFDCNETWCDVSSPTSLDVLLTNLMKGNLLPSALIWITTRPAAASKIPPDCIDRLTEIRGFNNSQKEEYFKKRFTDQNQANTIIDHVKKSKSLFIMCHIPVFCWISATVLQNILEEKRNNDVKINQADEISKTQQESNTEDTPKTLTQMYTHFLRFQIQQSHRKYDGEYAADVSWDKDAILSLGKLAFHQLERNNVIFYDSDLEACGIDVYKASVYSGMCTQIFKEETGITLGTMYCFVHLSIQEFIAALYAHLFLDINKTSVFDHESTEQENKNKNLLKTRYPYLFRDINKKNKTMIDFLKTAVDKALESDSGHLDLFLRFLLGLSLQSNRRLLRGLLKRQDDNDQSNKEIVQYIKQKLEDNLPAERSINLFYCLNELNDQTLVKEIQTHLSKGSLSSGDLSPAQWSALAFVLLTSEQELEEFELQKFKKSDECLIRLSAVIKTSRRALLNNCNLTDKSCPALAAVLGSDTNLKELNMNNNNLQDSGVKLLCTGLKNIKCKLEILRISRTQPPQKGAGKSDCRRAGALKHVRRDGHPGEQNSAKCYEPSYREECIPLI
ncbi:NLR family CARD domain-containing protein 3 [Anabarilius grahami]|uniref:NLR family CARD domain-containing protein 3 n=1 Tax=Anabarilius grahami TaxID=495550 RepID=A0A3N0XRB5_ANAGA|nr:NLR family CARD domain-containing protein 3 [Anabarilius grahami]